MRYICLALKTDSRQARPPPITSGIEYPGHVRRPSEPLVAAEQTHDGIAPLALARVHLLLNDGANQGFTVIRLALDHDSGAVGDEALTLPRDAGASREGVDGHCWVVLGD